MPDKDTKDQAFEVRSIKKPIEKKDEPELGDWYQMR